MADKRLAILMGATLLAGLGCLPWDLPGTQTDPSPWNGNDSDPPVVSAPSDANRAGPRALGRIVRFDVVLQQGDRVLLEAGVVIDDADPLDASVPHYYRIVDDYDYLGGTSNASVYLDAVVARPGNDLSSVHFALRSAKKSDHRKRANNPLFLLSETDKVSLRIDNLEFAHNGRPRSVSVFMYPFGDRAAAAGMLYYGELDSSYFMLPGAVVFDLASDNTTVQVPQSFFMDTDADYWFDENSGWSSSIAWQDMTSPQRDPSGLYPVIGSNGKTGLEPGEVFELTVSAVVWVMEVGE